MAEGEREDGYFQWFAKNRSRRLRIEIVPRVANASAPNHMLERVRRHLERYEVEPGDQVWFVLDVDRWQRSQIDTLLIHTKQEEDWFVAISNPCFEVWLHYHLGDITNIPTESCGNLKRLLHDRQPYHPDWYPSQLHVARDNARIADASPMHPFPDRNRTKLWQLAEVILERFGQR